MPYNLYQQTMEKLSRSLENRLEIPVEYLKKSLPVQKKWVFKNGGVIFPLVLNRHTAGQIKVQADLNESQLQTTQYLIQWTLHSLEKVFRSYNTCFYSGSKDIYPVLLVESSDEQSSLRQACNLYEQSPAVSFIHCHSAVWDRSLFSSQLNRTFIFISDLTKLSKENQMFLAHFIRTSFQKEQAPPLIAGSAPCSLKDVVRREVILSSLLENFVSFRKSIAASLPSVRI